MTHTFRRYCKTTLSADSRLVIPEGSNLVYSGTVHTVKKYIIAMDFSTLNIEQNVFSY